MKEQQKPRLKPSQRMKKRYLLFQYTAGKRVAFAKMKEFVKQLKIPTLYLIEFSSHSSLGIVRCERGKANSVRKTLNEIGLKTIRTSGTLKKLRSLA